MSGFPNEVLNIIASLSPTWLVGGSVRDEILGLPAKDFDVVTKLESNTVERILGEHGYKVHRIGAGFETLSVFANDQRIDIISIDSLETDAQRRDFSINCIYKAIESAEIFDPFHGLDDLKIRKLTACGKAEDRFREDPVRILRMIRFAVKYDLAIEEKTWDSACDLLGLLSNSASERITMEVVKILTAEQAVEGVRLLDKLGYWDVYLPELARLKGLVQNQYHSLDAWEHTLAVLQATPNDLFLRLAALFHDLGKWETASRECFLRGTLRKTAEGLKIENYKIIGTRGNKDLGKKLNHLAGREICLLGSRLDNYPETVQFKRLLASDEAGISHGISMISGGKRHFLNHEKKSAEVLSEVLKRFKFSMFFPRAGQSREKELLFIVASHMKGTLSFMPELKGTKSRMSTEKRAASLAWDICWDGREYKFHLSSEFMQLWKADYSAGKIHTSDEDRIFGDIQKLLAETCLWQKENINNIDWEIMHGFIRDKKITGNSYGQFKASVLREAILTKNIKLTQSFLSSVYANYKYDFQGWKY